MSSLVIKSIDISQSHFLSGLAPGAFVEQLSARLVTHTDEVKSVHPGRTFSHYICSSTLDILCSAGWFDPAVLARRVHELGGTRCTYSNAMQCATWGFLVRQHLVNKPDVRDIVLSIVDANPLRMRFWDDNSSWGKTSHRITLVHLQVPERVPSQAPAEPEMPIVIGKCNPSVMLYDYAREIQKQTAYYADHSLAIPYFEEKMRKGLRKSIGDYAHLPDQYEQYGHLCGSDPWMSIAMDGDRGDAGDKNYLASSIASEGYFCFLSANANAQSRMNIEG